MLQVLARKHGARRGRPYRVLLAAYPDPENLDDPEDR
jgi:hypothetical protein